MNSHPHDHVLQLNHLNKHPGVSMNDPNSQMNRSAGNPRTHRISNSISESESDSQPTFHSPQSQLAKGVASPYIKKQIDEELRPAMLSVKSPVNGNHGAYPHGHPSMMHPNGILSPTHPDLQLPFSPNQTSQTILSAGPKSPTQEPMSAVEAMLILTKGEDFIKWQSNQSLMSSVFGKSQKRYVFYEKEAGSMGKLYWCKPGMRTKDQTRCIELSNVTGMYEQAETDSFSKSLTAEQRSRCFSIVCGPKINSKGVTVQGRTLDLQARSVEVRNTWMHCIHQILIHSGFGVHEQEGKEKPHNRDGSVKSPASAQSKSSVNHSRVNSSTSSVASPNSGTNVPNLTQTNVPTPISSQGQSGTSSTSSSQSEPPSLGQVMALSPASVQPRTPFTSPASADSPNQAPLMMHSPLDESSIMIEPKVSQMPSATSEVKEIKADNDKGASKEVSPSISINDVPASFLSGESAQSSVESMPAELNHEVPANLTVPANDSTLPAALSPSEHPTVTPLSTPCAAGSA